MQREHALHARAAMQPCAYEEEARRQKFRLEPVGSETYSAPPKFILKSPASTAVFSANILDLTRFAFPCRALHFSSFIRIPWCFLVLRVVVG